MKKMKLSKRLPNKKNQRFLLMGAVFILAIGMLAIFVGNSPLQITYFEHYNDAGFDMVLSFAPEIEEIAGDVYGELYYVDNRIESVVLEIVLVSDAAPFDYIEISQRKGAAAATILVSTHDIVSAYIIEVTLDNIPTTYRFDVFARQGAVGVIGLESFGVECVGYGVTPSEPTTEPEPDFPIAGFEFIAIFSIIALIYKRKK